MNLLDYLNPTQKENLRCIAFHKEDILFREGEECRGVYFVHRGRLKIRSYTLDGVEIVYNALGPGMMFGNHLVFSSDARYRGDVVGESDGEIYGLPEEQLITYLGENPSFLRAFLREQADFGKALNLKIKILSLPGAKERLDAYLSLHHGRVRFQSVTSLAKELSLSREALSRLLHEQERLGQIQLSKNEIRSIDNGQDE